MTWTKIYNKYKDTESMKEFRLSYLKNMLVFPREIVDKVDISIYNIKDMFGYVICFAETKGYELMIVPQGFSYMAKITEKCGRTLGFRKELMIEQSMIWCASKFFEVAK